MLVNFFKFKNISKRGRVLSLLVVGGVFILLSFFALWSRNVADTLVQYVPSNSDFYAHFSRPKIKSAKSVDEILSAVLADFNLTDYKELNIAREVSIVGQLVDGEMEYGVIIRTDRPSRARKAIEESGQAYKFLSSTRIVIAPDDLLSGYQSNQDNAVATKVGGRFSSRNTISVYASKDILTFYSDDLSLRLFYDFLRDEEGDLFLNFQVKRDGLKVFANNTLKSVKVLDYFKATDPEVNINGDFVLVVSDLFQVVSNWRSNLKNASEYNSDIFEGGLLSAYLNTYLLAEIKDLVLVARENENSSGWLFSDYDFYMSVKSASAEKIEEILKIIMATRYPSIKSVYLSDGTRVRELRPNIDMFSFIEKEGMNILYSPDGQFKFMYKQVEDKIIITNNEELLDVPVPEGGFNYLKFDSDILLKESYWKYLSGFSSLEIGSGGLMIK